MFLTSSTSSDVGSPTDMRNDQVHSGGRQAYKGLDVAICRRAWAITQPVIEACATQSITEHAVGTMLVLDPVRSAHTDDPVTLFVASIGDPSLSTKYLAFAQAKAYTSWRTGLPSRLVQQDSPHLLAPGMTKWGGSTVRAGLVVAFSGVESIYDEMFSEMMASAVVALCRGEVSLAGGLMDAGPDFL